MPINLASNGRIGRGKWMGSDPAEINYPGVDTCITVTCRLGRHIVGAHLYYGNSDQDTRDDLALFAAQALGPLDIYIVGNLNSWKLPRAFRKELLFADGNGGTLFAAIREALRYAGVINCYQVTGNLQASLADGTLTMAQQTGENRYSVILDYMENRM
ncbi:MAG: hypothetical protein JWO09_775 [Bacteroidetes bacterium]|nr:hypothetical protein [Bacteroidota bacterium]